ncbi:Uncharacterised protein [Mycobacteroides abscessus subsp. abscessus]|nr:Uncharacterised protein [Mycobacteroides abscessus subsp. abscessus]
MISAVFSQTAGFDVRMSSSCTMPTAPKAAGSAGCSHSIAGGTTHDTLGSRLAATSARKSFG